MNYKVILIGAVITFILAFTGFYLVSRPEPKGQISPTSTGKITATATFYDFGSISMAKGPVSRTFAITNSDSIPATITKLYSSCMCTKGTLSVADKTWGPFGMPGHGAIPSIAAEVAPGQSGKIEVIFDPAAHGPAGVGKIERTVTAELNGQPALQFNFAANVTP